jgi:hypothetical protein
MPRNRSSGGRALAALVCVAATAASAATAPYNADLLTVSGRFEAPKAADGPLKARIKVVQAAIVPADARILMADAGVFQVGLKAGLEASMRNFGYLAPPELGDTLTLEVRMDPLEMSPDKDGVSAVARLHITSHGRGEACVPTIAEGKYHALAPIRGGNGERAVGIAGVVLFAAIGLNAGQFAAYKFQDAANSERAMNSQRVRTESEGVSPESGDRQVARYAAVSATQLAAADLIRQLGKSTCAAPGTAAAVPASTPAPAAPTPG